MTAAQAQVGSEDTALDALTGDALSTLSGGTDASQPTPVSLQVLTATNTGNSVVGTQVSSGDIGLSGYALSGFTGIGNYVFNTGHNNNLLGSVTVNVVLAPVGGGLTGP